MKKINTRKIDPKNLTPADFSILQRDAIEAYNNAIYMLGDVLKIGKSKFGRTNLMQLCPLNLTRVQWLIGIAEVKSDRSMGLTADHYAEVIGHPRATYWLRYAKVNDLNPLQLRKAIRSSEKVCKDVTPVKGICNYPRLMDQIEREIKRLPDGERARAQTYISTKAAGL